jgi:hypothetical protein
LPEGGIDYLVFQAPITLGTWQATTFYSTTSLGIVSASPEQGLAASPSSV